MPLPRESRPALPATPPADAPATPPADAPATPPAHAPDTSVHAPATPPADAPTAPPSDAPARLILPASQTGRGPLAGKLLPLSALLELQQGIATRCQLNARGINDMACYRHVRAGKWQRLLPGTYLLIDKPLTPEQRRIAASLHVGEDCQITGLAALQYYGLQMLPSTDKVHALVPHVRQVRSNGFLVVTRTLELDPNSRDTGLYRLTSPARAAVDAGRLSGDLEAVRAIMTETVQSHRASPKQIDEELRRAKRSRTGVPRRVLEEVNAGIRSVPESELRDLLATSKVIPKVLYNPTLMTTAGARLPTPDALIPDVWLAIEVDSKRFHSPASGGWVNTLERHNALLEVGIDTVHVIPVDISRKPEQVLRRIERTYMVRVGMVLEQPRVAIAGPDFT